MSSSSAVLTIVLVNFNSGEWLEKCLRSFSNLTGWTPKDKSIKTVLVDNASTDGSIEMVEKKFPWVEVQRLPKNRGFAAGNNAALGDIDTPYVMLLNTDTEFSANTDLLGFIEKNMADEKIAVLSPRVELSSGEIDHACHRGFPTPWNAAMYFSGLAKRFPKSKITSGYTMGWEDTNTAHAIQACTGAAMIVRSTALQQVGLLDEAFFMYAEDIDWCARFVAGGWMVWYDPSVVVIHHKHKSGKGKTVSSETRERTTAAFYDTMKQYFRKHSAGTPALVLLLLFAIIDLLKYRKLAQERTEYVHE